MYEPILPQGPQAALMPGAAYSVPGLFLYSSLVCQCLDQVEAKFGYRIPVRYLYGSPQARWNCGRPIIVDHGYTMEDIQAELQGVLDRGITPLLTFSMPRMTERDLEDPLGNAILDLLNRPEKLEHMRECQRRIIPKNAAQRICDLAEAMAAGKAE